LVAVFPRSRLMRAALRIFYSLPAGGCGLCRRAGQWVGERAWSLRTFILSARLTHSVNHTLSTSRRLVSRP